MFDELTDTLVEMKEKEAVDQARDLLEAGQDPVAILNACTRAMEAVGDRFEKGEYFVPQLMMAGEILGEISEMVKPYLQSDSEDAGEKKGKVLHGHGGRATSTTSARTS
jgi:methanogenic corrinoid protein MtbC1